jgi:hypothetical protein
MKVEFGWNEYPSIIGAIVGMTSETVDEHFNQLDLVTDVDRNALKTLHLDLLQGNTSFEFNDRKLFPLVAFRTGPSGSILSLPDSELDVNFGDADWEEWETNFVGHIFDQIRQVFSHISDSDYTNLREATTSTIFEYCTFLDGSASVTLEDGTPLLPHLGFSDADPWNRESFVTIADPDCFILHDYVHGWDSELYE